ncbi:MAG: hypothetical protein U0446_08520 [Dehalococcoidia bacterium]
MSLYQLSSGGLHQLPVTTFQAMGIKERSDLQATIRDCPEILGEELLIISEEFGDWEDSSRRIDLLALDARGQLVVIELKRDAPGFADLQAIRYAAMVANMTFERVVETYDNYLRLRELEGDAEESLATFLPTGPEGASVKTEKPRIILVSGDFSKERELTTAALWLNDVGLDVVCVELKPYEVAGQPVIDANRIIPVAEEEIYRLRRRERTAEVARLISIPWTADDVARLKAAVTNPSVRLLLDLLSADPATSISFAILVERSGRSVGQVRGDLASLTALIKSQFGRSNWPIYIDWIHGQANYRIDEHVASWWLQATQQPSAG